MNKIKIWFENYFRKSSRLKIAGDIFFWVFIILLLIPTTRKEIATVFNRITMGNPKMEEKGDFTVLKDSDYAFRFVDIEGTTYSLNDFRGEVIFLNYWATWCPPCRAEMPAIQGLYDDYGEKIKMLLLSSENRNTLISYLSENEYQLPVYQHIVPEPKNLAVNAYPTTYLIDRKGQVRIKKTGAADWNSDKFRAQLDILIGE